MAAEMTAKQKAKYQVINCLPPGKLRVVLDVEFGGHSLPGQ